MNTEFIWNVTDKGKNSSKKLDCLVANLSTNHLTWTAVVSSLGLGDEKSEYDNRSCDDAAK
jgi:hypothetical protein